MAAGTVVTETMHTSEILPSTLPSNFDEAATQAAIKGGIGFYVAQGLAKRGHTCNPNHSCFSHAVTRKALHQQLKNTWASCPSEEDTCQDVFHRPAFEYERNQKTDVFRVSSRSTRCSDMDTASKWAALSFFENDPKRIRHHLEILESIENQDMLDSLASRAQREQRLTAVQDRIRYDFGVRQLQNTLKSTRSGQRARTPGPASSTYTRCRTEPSLTVQRSGPASSHSSSAGALQRTPSTPPVQGAQDHSMRPHTAMPSAASALQKKQHGSHVGSSGVAGCTETRRQPKLGTPKVGVSTWTWGGASATLAAVAGVAVPVAASPPPQKPPPARPNTARPFRIRSKMEQELNSKMRPRRASSAHPARRETRDETDLQELDRFQQRLDYWRARQPQMAQPLQSRRENKQAQDSPA